MYESGVCVYGGGVNECGACNWGVVVAWHVCAWVCRSVGMESVYRGVYMANMYCFF